MRVLNLLTAVIAVAAGTTCTNRVPEPVGVAPGTPHISWVLMSGDANNPDADYVCQSDPKDNCVISASRPDRRVFSDLHIYYHGAGVETRYTGSIRVGYFDNPHTLEPKILVRKSERITNQSVTGIVVTTPGAYAVTFDLMASTANGQDQPIRQMLDVTVK